MEFLFFLFLLLLIIAGIYFSRWIVTRQIRGHDYGEDPDWADEVYDVVSEGPPERSLAEILEDPPKLKLEKNLMDRALDDEGGMGRLSGIKP